MGQFAKITSHSSGDKQDICHLSCKHLAPAYPSILQKYKALLSWRFSFFNGEH